MPVAFHGPVRSESLAGELDSVLDHAGVDSIHDPHQFIGLVLYIDAFHVVLLYGPIKQIPLIHVRKQIRYLSLALGSNIQKHDACLLVVMAWLVDSFQSLNDVFDQNPCVISCPTPRSALQNWQYAPDSMRRFRGLHVDTRDHQSSKTPAPAQESRQPVQRS